MQPIRWNYVTPTGDGAAQALRTNVHGFTSLTPVVQYALIGYAVTTGEVWETHSMVDTRIMAKRIMAEIADMIEAFGVES